MNASSPHQAPNSLPLDLAPVPEKTAGQSRWTVLQVGNECLIRLMTPLNMRYEDSLVRTYPFDRLVDGMLQPEMVLEMVDIIKGAIEKGVTVNLIINNRAGGNAPMIAQIIAEKLIPKPTPKMKGQLSLW